MENRPTVCVIAPNKNAYSETFIRAHIERLPAQIAFLYGHAVPNLNDGRTDAPIVPPFTLGRHVKQSFARRVRGVTWEGFQEASLLEYLKAKRVNAVLAEYGHMGVAVMDACREARIPLIVNFFGVDAFSHETLNGPGQRYPELFENAAAVIAVSRHMENHLLELGAPRETLYYNPCGADIDQFRCTNPAQNPPLFVAIGRFVDKKAPLLTLMAFRQLLENLPDARLVMVGNGYLFEASLQLARALGINNAVAFPGPLPHAKLTEVMQGARAFVQHSVTTTYGDSEGTPVSIIEAGATGLPVVSTRHGGIPDVVVSGETGILVEEGDVDGMAQAMLKLAQDPPLAQEMGVAARNRVAMHFSLDQTIATLWQIISSVAEDHSQENARR